MSSASAPASDLVRAALALELQPGSQPARAGLKQAEAGALLAQIAVDLGRLTPAAQSLDLVLGAAHFDPAELLRPGWPLHRRLHELHARAPRAAPGDVRLLAFGADAEGRLPLPLQAEDGLRGGALRLLPLAMIGAPDAVAAAAEECERDLLERGMAGAATALAAQEAFGVPIEHARYLTAHDLAALTAMQYEHVGLAPLWPLIETALLAPQREVWLDAPPEPLLRHADGAVRMALIAQDDWQARHAPGADAARAARGYAQFRARQRQYAAVLAAHGITVEEIACAAGEDAHAALRG